MKKVLVFILLGNIVTGCSRYLQDTPSYSCESATVSTGIYAKQDSLRTLLDSYSRKGIPGMVVAVYTPTGGYWGHSSGFSKIEDNTPMKLCHLHYLQSASKMYMGCAILKLRDEGKLHLDSSIIHYLPSSVAALVDNARTITIRQLLNQTSGINDYLENPSYISYVLQHPDYVFSGEELVGYIKGKKQRFIPGSRYQYCNTNYLLLALVADNITGDHNEYIRQHILLPLGLSHTFYRQIKGQPYLTNSYMDRFSTGIVENVSRLQQTSITFSRGDDGIIATPYDAIGFLKGLMEGKLLKDSSFREMMNFVKDADGKPVYGMGIFNIEYFGQTGYGHGGAGAGAGCGLYYFPGKELYVFVAVNLGVLVDGPLVKITDEFKFKLLDLMLK